MKREHEIILKSVVINKSEREVTEISDLLNEKLDWIEIAGQLINHRLAGYFYMGLNDEQKNMIPEELRKTMRLIVKQQKIDAHISLDEAARIFDRLDDQGIRYAPLKGLWFNVALYDRGIRRSNDLDVLVCEEDLEIFDEIMRSLGYIQSLDNDEPFTEASRKEKLIQRMNYHDLVPYVKVENNNIFCIDVNFLFDGKNNPIDYKVYQYGFEQYEDNEYKIKGLTIYTNLAFLIVHFYREATESIWVSTNRDLSIYKIVDIVNYLRKYFSQIDVLELNKILRDLNLVEKSLYTFGIISCFYDDEITRVILNSLIKESQSLHDDSVIEMLRKIKEKGSKYIHDTFYYLH